MSPLNDQNSRAARFWAVIPSAILAKVGLIIGACVLMWLPIQQRVTRHELVELTAADSEFGYSST